MIGSDMANEEASTVAPAIEHDSFAEGLPFCCHDHAIVLTESAGPGLAPVKLEGDQF